MKHIRLTAILFLFISLHTNAQDLKDSVRCATQLVIYQNSIL